MTRAAAPVAAALLLAACAGGLLGPPAAPPAPPAARGFLAVTPQGVELEFDASRQSYEVRSRPGTYWLDGRFFRGAGDGWESSPSLDGPWQGCAAGDLPPGLRAASLAK